MAGNLTLKGREYILNGTADPNGSIRNLAAYARLYDSTSTPNVNGTGFVQIGSGTGYPSNGWVITRASWSGAAGSSTYSITLSDIVLTATGGTIANIQGLYITDSAGNVLAWWDNGGSPITISSGASITVSNIVITI